MTYYITKWGPTPKERGNEYLEVVVPASSHDAGFEYLRRVQLPWPADRGAMVWVYKPPKGAVLRVLYVDLR